MYISVRNIKFAYVSTFRIQFVNWSERVIYMWVMIYCFSLLYHCQHLSRIQLYIWATRWFLIWSSNCFALTWVFDRVSVAHLFRFLRCVFCFVLFVLVLCVMYSMWPVSLYFPFRIAPSDPSGAHEINTHILVRFVLLSLPLWFSSFFPVFYQSVDWKLFSITYTRLTR
jgi:hypothetical protein